jgi:ADP-heptose:LPS heptosyltransferase
MSVYANGASALSGPYLVRNPVLRAALTLRDSYLRLGNRGPSNKVPDVPRRLIVAVGGQLGDAVVATSAIQQIRDAFPSCAIGVMCPPVTTPVFENHPAVERVHVVDHWFWGRSGQTPISMGRRWGSIQSSRRSIIRDIAAAAYEMSIDLYPYFPNGSTIFAASQVPVRAGWASGGGGPLLTHPLAWRDTRAHVAHQHTEVLEHCWPRVSFGAPRYSLAPLSAEATEQGRSLLSSAKLSQDGYTVLHPGTSNSLKRWPTEKWVDLMAQLDGPIAITGAGAADGEQIAAIRASRTDAVSLWNQTDFATLRFVLRNARAVVSVDSVAGHLAAAEGRPTVAIMSAMADPHHWAPLGENVRALTAAVPCAPCFRTAGCAAMACVRDVSVGEVVDAIRHVG